LKAFKLPFPIFAFCKSRLISTVLGFAKGLIHAHPAAGASLSGLS
jgi:hypothetical protein